MSSDGFEYSAPRQSPILFFRSFEGELIHSTDKYSSLIWNDKFSVVGDFEIVMSYSEFTESGIYNYPECFVSLDNSRFDTKILTDIEISFKGQSASVKLKGKDTAYLLRKRVIFPLIQNGSTTSPELLIKNVFNKNVFSGAGSRKMIDGELNFENYSSRGDKVSYTAKKGETVLDFLVSLAKAYAFGFKLVPPITIGSSNTSYRNWTLHIFNDSDSNGSKMVFSDDNGTLSDLVVKIPHTADATDILVIGREDQKTKVSPFVWAGTGNLVKYKRYPTSEPGLTRCETFLDGGNIEDPSDPNRSKVQNANEQSGETIPPIDTGLEPPSDSALDDLIKRSTSRATPYGKVLYRKGVETLVESRQYDELDFDVDSGMILKYGVDYKLGDIVNVFNTAGYACKARIEEVIRSYSATEHKEYPKLKRI